MRLRVSDRHNPGYDVDPSELDLLIRQVGIGRFHTLLRARRSRNGICPVCGWTQAQLAETGLVGCGACYETLRIG